MFMGSAYYSVTAQWLNCYWRTYIWGISAKPNTQSCCFCWASFYHTYWHRTNGHSIAQCSIHTWSTVAPLWQVERPFGGFHNIQVPWMDLNKATSLLWISTPEGFRCWRWKHWNKHRHSAEESIHNRVAVAAPQRHTTCARALRLSGANELDHCCP